MYHMIPPMREWSQRKFWLVVLSACFVTMAGGYAMFIFFNPFHAHEHCIKIAMMDLESYAFDHAGRYPFHTNGFGDAIVLLLRESTNSHARYFTAPGDSGDWLREHVRHEGDVPEEQCSRAYVQGLTKTNNPAIALVFDRYPTPGGDHFRKPWGSPLREVSLLGGEHRFINEKDWPEFRRKQIELLVAEGISRIEADRLYRPPLK